MKSASLPCWLARIFTVLFYGQIIACAFTASLLLSLLLTRQKHKMTEAFYVQMPLSGIISTDKSTTLLDPIGPHWLLTADQRKMALGVPATLSHAKPDSDTYWLRFSVSSWHDLSLLPISLLLSAVLVIILSLCLSLYICYLFMRLFQSLAEQHIFDQSQVRRLLLIGQGFLVYAILVVTCRLVSQEIMIGYLHNYGYGVMRFPAFRFSVELLIEFVFFLTGLCILGLTQVFKYGMQLKQENELTI